MMFLHVSRKERLRNKQNKLPIERLIQIEIKKKKKIYAKRSFSRSIRSIAIKYVFVFCPRVCTCILARL